MEEVTYKQVVEKRKEAYALYLEATKIQQRAAEVRNEMKELWNRLMEQRYERDS